MTRTHTIVYPHPIEAGPPTAREQIIAQLHATARAQAAVAGIDWDAPEAGAAIRHIVNNVLTVALAALDFVAAERDRLLAMRARLEAAVGGSAASVEAATVAELAAVDRWYAAFSS